MNPGQQMFHDFYMGLVKEGCEQEAEELLQTGFEKQADGTFDGAYFASVKDRYFELIKPEHADKLRSAMDHFTSQR